MKYQKSIEDDLFKIGIWMFFVIPALGFLFFFVFTKYLPQFPCVAYSIWGIYCPGCGGTRAVVSLVHGHFLRSLWYHPIVLYCIVLYAGFMITQGLHRIGVKKIHPWRFHEWYLWGMLIIMVGNWIFKNVLLLVFHIKM